MKIQPSSINMLRRLLVSHLNFDLILTQPRKIVNPTKQTRPKIKENSQKKKNRRCPRIQMCHNCVQMVNCLGKDVDVPFISIRLSCIAQNIQPFHSIKQYANQIYSFIQFSTINSMAHHENGIPFQPSPTLNVTQPHQKPPIQSTFDAQHYTIIHYTCIFVHI